MKVVIIIANQGYQDKEYSVSKKILEDAGVEVITAAKYIGKAEGILGGSTNIDLCLGDVHVFDYDGVIFVGGPGAVKYQEDIEAHLIIREAFEQEKIIGAICIAPTILAHAGILDGKKATCWNKNNEQSKKLVSQGAKFVDSNIVVDGKIVTANGPDAAEEFGLRLLEILNN